jgi:hypothetical protein
VGQPFSPKSNAIAKLSLWMIVVIICGGLAFAMGFVRTDYVTGKHEVLEQNVPFSHKHHVKGLGLDCRFCHFSVERSAFAGIPDTQTCMTCHSEIWKTSAALKPVRDSFANNQPLEWKKVYRLPGYVYFNHSVHIAKGVGCVSCHSTVSEMPRITQERTFLMKDCMECHQHPEKFIRPLDAIYDENWKPFSDEERQLQVMHQNHVQPQNLTDCTRCHR